MAHIVDVRAHESGQFDLRQGVLNGLARPVGERTLPTLLLYDEHGLRLYDNITTDAPEYYLFPAEKDILKVHAGEIARAMYRGQAEEVVLELGAGALRKTSLILHALSIVVEKPATPEPITYYALDLDRRELERTLHSLAVSDVGPLLSGKVDTQGMLGTYDDGIRFVEEGGLRGRRPIIPEELSGASWGRPPARDLSPASSGIRSTKSNRSDPSTAPSTPARGHPPLHILFLGSSLGNFARGEDASFLRSLPLRPGSGDTILLGLDHSDDTAKIELAYNDAGGHNRAFLLNGLKVAGRTLGDEDMFADDKWIYVNKYNKQLRRHEAYYQSTCAQTVRNPANKLEVEFLANEMIHVECSNKYSEEDTYSLLAASNLRTIQRWTWADSSSGKYSLWLLERPPFSFPLLIAPSETTSPFNVPALSEFRDMWAAWDFITLRMIPPSMLHQKPIDLRHICLFYLGHIPAFLDIHLSRFLQEPHTEPENFKTIFERGIDPNVDDPTMCHSHSIVPERDEDWPTLDTILDFTRRVRARLVRVYAEVNSGQRPLTRALGRVLFMTLEHEAFHAETLLYMLLQRAGAGTIPPPDFTVPPWPSLESAWASTPGPTQATTELGPATVMLGHDDVNSQDANTPYDGAHEYGWDNESPARTAAVGAFRISWRPVTNGEYLTFYRAYPGVVKLPKSWVETGADIHVRTLHGPVPIKIAQEWPVVADYDGLSAYATVKGGRLPTEAELRLFYDKFECGYERGANVGFRNWHPIPATTGGTVDGGKGHNGGVWEWTSTTFAKHEGFAPSALYPGYSADFFDGCHKVVIGGSYATIPRLASRRSLRNWYQANYGYAWIGGRIAYDIAA